jgi:glycosyltransferase involved in cell wall biosynthesis
VGGAERVMASLVSQIKANGDDVAVASAPGPLAGELDCPIHPLPLLERHPRRVPWAAVCLHRAIRVVRPDVLHCHNPGMALLGGLVTRRGRALAALVSVHGVPQEDYPATARILRWSGLPAVACGPGVAATLSVHGLQVRSTIMNGVSPPPGAIEEIAPLLRQWGLDPGHRLVVAVGRLVEQKNHSLAVRAMASVPHASLVILGSGPLGHELQQLALELGVADRVALPGDRADARSVMASADVVVLPSLWEGLPLVGLEALAARTPLVATAALGIKEILKSEVHCLLVEPDDPEALAAGLRRVLGDPSLAARLVEGGAELVTSFTESAMADQFTALYGRLLACRE